jgi:hypothetical protein
MKFILSLAVLATAVTAQTTSAAGASSTGSACAADYIVEACLGTTQAKFEACGDNDWNCKCAGQQAIAT